MSFELIATLVSVLGLTVLLAGLVRVRARTVIGRVQRTLREQMLRQNKEILRHRKEIDVLREQVSWLEGRLALSAALQPLLPPRPKHAKRSVLFLQNGTYNFVHLAGALRRRGWDAVVATNLPFSHHNHFHRHAAAVDLFSNDPSRISRPAKRIVPPDAVPISNGTFWW